MTVSVSREERAQQMGCLGKTRSLGAWGGNLDEGQLRSLHTQALANALPT